MPLHRETLKPGLKSKPSLIEVLPAALCTQMPVLTQAPTLKLTARQVTPEEGDRYAAEDDGAPHARAVLRVARRADTEDGSPHVLLRFLQDAH